MPQRYFLQFVGLPEQEATREQFLQAERSAGFRSKFGPDHLATAGFSSGSIRGRIEVDPAADREPPAATEAPFAVPTPPRNHD